MKTLAKLLSMLLLASTLFQCTEDEEITPSQPTGNKKADTLNVKSGSAQADNFSIIGEKSNETTTGYDVEGALYLDTDSGQVAVLEEAAFTVTQNASGVLESIKGTGPVSMPDMGMFKSFSFKKEMEATFEYNTGKYFKELNTAYNELPLQDTSYYFLFDLVNLAPQELYDFAMQNADISASSFFVNIPREEVIFSSGNFEYSTPSGPIKVGNGLAIGISGKGSFSLTPTAYNDSTINALIEKHKAFDDIKGPLYLQGEMSIHKKMPLKLTGKAVIKGEINDIFTNGLNAASFVYGLNGTLKFGSDLLDFLPVDFETELTRVTYRLEQTYKEDGTLILDNRYIGEFDDNAWMEKVIDGICGDGVSQYVPLTGNEGAMFTTFGTNVDDFEMYVKAAFAINTPHLGKQETRHGMFHITSEKVGISAGMGLPFVPGEILASGEIDYEGNLHLTGQTSGDLKIKDVSLASDLTVDIYNDKATLSGNITVPYNIGKVNVNGTIDQTGMTLNGDLATKHIDFGNGVVVPIGELKMSAAINETNPHLSMSGKMILHQFDDPLVAVTGTINSKGLEFTGDLKTDISLQRFTINKMHVPLVNMSLTARTWEGVKFNGQMSIPFGFGTVNTTGILTSKKDKAGFPEVKFQANFTSNPVLNVHGFSYYAAGVNLSASSVEGIKFSGKMKFTSKLGWGTMQGSITGNSINFSGNINQKVAYGKRVLASNLSYNAGSNRYPNIASVKGTVYTGFGNVSVNGVIGLNGNFEYSGAITACKDIDLIFYESAKVSKNFIFKNSGVTLGASVSACGESCDKGGDCDVVDVDIDVNWNEKRFKVCALSGAVCF